MFDFLAALFSSIVHDPAGLGALVGILTPLVVAVLLRPTMSKRARTVVSVGASIVLGIATAWASGMLDTSSVATILVSLYLACETFYQKLWKQIGASQAIEFATSPASTYKAVDGDYSWGDESR